MERKPTDMLEIISHDGLLLPSYDGPLLPSYDDDDDDDEDDEDDKPFSVLGPGRLAPFGNSSTNMVDKIQDLDSPSSNGSPVHMITDDIAGFGPIFGEEEDLRRAIELSMAETPLGM